MLLKSNPNETSSSTVWPHDASMNITLVFMVVADSPAAVIQVLVLISSFDIPREDLGVTNLEITTIGSNILERVFIAHLW